MAGSQHADALILPVHGLQVVREGSRRVLGLRPFDVQLMGGVILHEGHIAEMRTGEVRNQLMLWTAAMHASCTSCVLDRIHPVWLQGKTLVAVLPAYLNALLQPCKRKH